MSLISRSRLRVSKISFKIVAEDFSPKSFRYHPGLFKINKWSCCRNVSRTALGCLVTTAWPEKNNNCKSEYTLSCLYFYHISRHLDSENNNRHGASNFCNQLHVFISCYVLMCKHVPLLMLNCNCHYKVAH